MHYSQNCWTEAPSADEWTVQHECVPEQVFIFGDTELRTPGIATAEDKVAFALRHLCHFLVDQIDNKGLEEVCRSLAEFYAYYRPTEHTRQMPEVRTKLAIGCSRSTSPTFVIGEE